MTRRALVAGAALVVAVLTDGALSAETPSESITEQVALDNDSVRVTVLSLPPGASTGIHINAEPELGIVAEGELTLVTRSGKEVFRPGQVVWLATMTGHEARNEGKRPVKIWALSLKRCQ